MSEACLFPNCKNFAQANGFCIGHKWAAGEKFEAPKVKSIPKKSEKRVDQDRVYKKQRIKFLKKNPFCKAKLKGCSRVAEEIHHKKGRVGDNYLDEKTWVGVCRNCHNKIESEPAKAKEKGLSESRLSAVIISPDKVNENQILIAEKIK